tara:strand:- start:410 stop:526 length:117 start_codon:yes stop_codon:yes gene_type:complete
MREIGFAKTHPTKGGSMPSRSLGEGWRLRLSKQSDAIG